MPSGLRRLYGPEADAPHALYGNLRQEQGPVAKVLLPGDVPAWLVLGHRENLEVMRTTLLYSSDSRTWNVRLPADSPLLPVTMWQPLVAFTDGEEHGRLRNAITGSLERFNRHGVRRYVVRYTNQLIDGFAATGRADLVADLAEKLPSLVLARLFGIPEGHALPMGEAVRDMIRGSETALQSNQYVVDVMSELVKRKKEQPGEDLASWLPAHESGLTDDEVVEHLRHAIVASTETTTNLIANALRMVLTDRRFRGHLSGGHMTLPDALEQVMWDSPPLAVVPTRWATGDTVLGGQQIRAGDMVMLGLAAGNMDPQIRPDLGTPVHGNRSHLAFGGGPHECPGQDIGRAIADTGIDTLLARIPDMELAVHEGELNVTTSLISQRLDNLPVHFRRQGTAGSAAPAPTASVAQPLPAAHTVTATVPASAPVNDQNRGPWWRRLLRRLR
ncbi:cytochrome P450 [Streptomyces sp. NPDC005408]|uniref:cytochrome P450 n=1 Tax=Streptomyces sp. NPDC005408 TaxID=3155341 RepID=UPI0033AAF3F4